MQRSIKNALILATCLTLVQPTYPVGWLDWAKNGLKSMVTSIKKAQPEEIVAYTIIAAAITAGGYMLYRWWYTTNEKLIADADREIANANSALDAILREDDPRTIINDNREATLSMVAQNMYSIGNKIESGNCQAKLNMATINLIDCRTQLTKRAQTIANKPDQQPAHQRMLQQINVVNQLMPIIVNRIHLLHNYGAYFDAYRSEQMNNAYYGGEFQLHNYTLPELQPYIMSKNAQFPYREYAQHVQSNLEHINGQIAQVKASFERTGNATELIARLELQAIKFSAIYTVISQSPEYKSDYDKHRIWKQEQERLRIERERLAHEKAVDQQRLANEHARLHIAQQKADAATLAAQAALIQAQAAQQQANRHHQRTPA